jgi:hypothetical protein
LWTETVVGWDSTRYIGLAKLILQDFTFLRVYAPFLFPLLLALGIHINPNDYFWAVIWYRIIETFSISAIIFITVNYLRKLTRSRWLKLTFIILLVCSFRNFILSMYMPFTLALLFSNIMLIISEKIILEKGANKTLYLLISIVTLIIILSNNLYHVLLVLMALVIYIVNNRKITYKVNFFKIILVIILVIVFSYFFFSRLSIAYAVALAQIVEPIKDYFPKHLKIIIYEEPFEKLDPLFMKIIDNFASASHLIVLTRPARLYDAIAFYYFSESEFLILLLANLISYIALFSFKKETKQNINLNYYLGIVVLMIINTILLFVTRSNYYVTYLFRFNGIYDLRVFFFILLLILVEKYDGYLLKRVKMGGKVKRYKGSLLVVVAVVAVTYIIVSVYEASPRVANYAYVRTSDVSFLREQRSPLATGKNITLITTVARLSYPGILNQIEGLLWYFGGSNIVIFPVLDLNDICFINRTLNSIAYNFTFYDPILNLLQYYYSYVYFERLNKTSCTSLTLIISESVYKSKYEKIFVNYKEPLVINRSCNAKYCAFLIRTIKVCNRC